MNKDLSSITPDEWEAICRRCGRCCLLKLQDDETEEIYYTNVICRYYDIENNLCTVYDARCELVPECLKLTPQNVDKISWMPQACAYRKLFDKNYKEQNVLPLQGRVISEALVSEDELEDHITDEEI